MGRVDGIEEMKATVFGDAMVGLESWKFPTDFYMIDGDTVVVKWRQVLPGSAPTAVAYAQSGYSTLVYAGDGKFSYEEDLLNMVHVFEDIKESGFRFSRRHGPRTQAEPRLLAARPGSIRARLLDAELLARSHAHAVPRDATSATIAAIARAPSDATTNVAHGTAAADGRSIPFDTARQIRSLSTSPIGMPITTPRNTSAALANSATPRRCPRVNPSAANTASVVRFRPNMVTSAWTRWPARGSR